MPGTRPTTTVNIIDISVYCRSSGANEYRRHLSRKVWSMMKFGVGQPVTRFEDARLLRGRGRFQDDVNVSGQLYAVFVRSPHAHARIRSVDVAAAAAAPGVA